MKNNFNPKWVTKAGLLQSCNKKKQFFAIGILSLALFVQGCKKDVPETELSETFSKKNELSASTNANALAAAVPTRNEALVAMQVFNNTFYNQYGTVGSSFKANYWKDQGKTGKMDFWMQNEAIEVLIDAYYINPNDDFKNKITYLYNGIIAGSGTLWTNNKFNDDIVWGALMSLRAYKITNNSAMLTTAQSNFDMMWNRAWDTALDGGLWWTTDNTSKNACVNAPAAICAIKLYEATGNADYKTKAKMIMDWMVAKLYRTTGELKGAMNQSGVITEGPLSYTQGTFIGACQATRTYYPNEGYLDMGLKVLDYTRSNMCITSGGILKDEYGNADTQGMKGIFARWACTFIKATGTQANYGPWLDDNAGQAWSIRNSKGLMWGKWGVRTSETAVLSAFETSPGVSMVNNIYWYK
jgi:predicted alpha-1,6-mannanase (GH76 family)